MEEQFEESQKTFVVTGRRNVQSGGADQDLLTVVQNSCLHTKNDKNATTLQQDDIIFIDINISLPTFQCMKITKRHTSFMNKAK